MLSRLRPDQRSEERKPLAGGFPPLLSASSSDVGARAIDTEHRRPAAAWLAAAPVPAAPDITAAEMPGAVYRVLPRCLLGEAGILVLEKWLLPVSCMVCILPASRNISDSAYGAAWQQRLVVVVELLCAFLCCVT